MFSGIDKTTLNVIVVLEPDWLTIKRLIGDKVFLLVGGVERMQNYAALVYEHG